MPVRADVLCCLAVCEVGFAYVVGSITASLGQLRAMSEEATAGWGSVVCRQDAHDGGSVIQGLQRLLADAAILEPELGRPCTGCPNPTTLVSKLEPGASFVVGRGVVALCA